MEEKASRKASRCEETTILNVVSSCASPGLPKSLPPPLGVQVNNITCFLL